MTFWAVEPCSLVVGDQRFGGPCCLLFRVEMLGHEGVSTILLPTHRGATTQKITPFFSSVKRNWNHTLIIVFTRTLKSLRPSVAFCNFLVLTVRGYLAPAKPQSKGIIPCLLFATAYSPYSQLSYVGQCIQKFLD